MSDNPIFSSCRSARAGFGFSRAGFGSVCVGSESARAGFAGRRSGAVLAAAVLVFFVLIVSSCSCGGGRTDDGGQPVAFPFPEAPLMVQQQGPVAVAEYLCGHFWNDYLDTWLHNDEIVTVQSDIDPEDKCKAMIIGISPLSGMLLAKKDDGKVLELFPDTHSLNLMDKLIYKKKLQ